MGECPKPDALFVTVSSCGTVAGLLVGLSLAGLSVPVIGIRVVDAWMANTRHVDWLVWGLRRLVRRRLPGGADLAAGPLPSFTLLHDYFGGGYGAPTAQSELAVELAKQDGLRLENTYTGKTFAAIGDWGRRNPGKIAVFWNTYNGVDLSSVVGGLDYHRLPQVFWPFFDTSGLSR